MLREFRVRITSQTCSQHLGSVLGNVAGAEREAAAAAGCAGAAQPCETGESEGAAETEAGRRRKKEARGRIGQVLKYMFTCAALLCVIHAHTQLLNTYWGRQYGKNVILEIQCVSQYLFIINYLQNSSDIYKMILSPPRKR